MTEAKDRLGGTLLEDRLSPEDRARLAIHAAAMDPDENRVLVREIGKAISDAEMSVVKIYRVLLAASIK